MKFERLRNILGIGFVLLVIYLSLTPELPDIAVSADQKIGHVLAYGWPMRWFAKERQRTLYFSMYSDGMGEGQRVYSRSEAGDWAPVPRGSIVEKLWKIACGE